MFRYLYCIFCLTSLRTFGRFKIGISSDVTARRGQIASELGIPARRLWHLSFPVFFPEKMESRLHRLFSGLRAKMPYHRGHTEWFRIRNYAALVVFLWGTDLQGEALPVAAFLVLFAPVPLDGFLAVLAAVAVQAAIVLGVVFGGVAVVFYLC